MFVLSWGRDRVVGQVTRVRGMERGLFASFVSAMLMSLVMNACLSGKHGVEICLEQRASVFARWMHDMALTTH